MSLYSKIITAGRLCFPGCYIGRRLGLMEKLRKSYNVSSVSDSAVAEMYWSDNFDSIRIGGTGYNRIATFPLGFRDPDLSSNGSIGKAIVDARNEIKGKLFGNNIQAFALDGNLYLYEVSYY